MTRYEKIHFKFLGTIVFILLTTNYLINIYGV